MYITPITNNSFCGSTIRISAYSNANKKHPFLYNEVLDIVRKEKIGANFHTKKIVLPSPPQTVLKKLDDLKIKYEIIKNS